MAAIKAQIQGGTLGPGDRLPSERDLARSLEVSRPSVREAIGALQNEGLVFTRPGAGSFISDDARRRSSEGLETERDTDASPVALLEARALLEPAAARLAASRAGPDELVEALLRDMDGVSDVEDPEQRLVWSDADRLFHRQIGFMTDNPFLADFAELVGQVMDQPLWRRLRDEAVSDPRRVRLYAAEHRMIYEAVVAGEPEAASFYAAQHVRRVRVDMGLE